MIRKAPVAEKIFSQLPPDVCAVLLYGSDEGKVQQLANILKKTVTADDPFSYTEIAAEQLDKDTGLLSEALLSPSLMGGKRLVRLRNAGHTHTKTLKMILEEKSFSPQDVVLLVDSNATKKGSLQKLFEDPRRDIIAVPCYQEEGAAKSQQIQQFLAEKQLSLPRECIQYLQAVLPADSQLAATEVEKLSLYAGEKPSLTLAEVELCCAGLYEASFDDFSYGILEGNVTGALNAVKRLEQDGIPAIVLVKAALNLATQLLKVSESKQPTAIAVNSLRPPIFFKMKARFTALANHWHSQKITRALNILLQLEKRLKSKPQVEIPAIIGQSCLALHRIYNTK